MNPVVVLGLSLLSAPEPPLEGHALALTANPNEASLRYQWRGALRAMAGVTIPIVESARTPWVFVFSPMLEISNGPATSAPVPFEHWRGRASLELGYRLDLEERPDRSSLRVSLLVTHESAHETVAADVFIFAGAGIAAGVGPQAVIDSPSSQLHTNDVGLRLFATMSRGPTLLAFVFTQRLHFASCTVRALRCDDVRFAFGLETELDFMIEGFALDDDRWLRPYAAISGQVIPAIEDMGLEGRAVLEAGATLDPGRLGRFRLFLSGVAGHEPGFRRERAVLYGGVGVGFAFF